MSLEEAAAKIASYLRSKDYVEVYSHHDADGIAAAAILTVALRRADIAFRLRFLPHLNKDDVERPELSVLCDLGASVPDFPESIVIIDHHVPYAAVPFHINPRLEGIDGESELSAAGCAYLVANALGDNRDLAGLVMVGIIGDSQKLSGMNQKIIGDAVGNNLIEVGKGVLLPGRTTKEQIASAVLPYLGNLSGDEETAEKIASLCMNTASDEAYTALLLSEIIVRSDASYHDLMSMYGESWKLLREAVQDAYAMTAVIDACGKAGRPDLGYAVAAGDMTQTDAAWETANAFRRKIIASAAAAEAVAENVWLSDSVETASDVADIFVRSKQMPVVVLARGTEYLKVSARAPADSSVDFEQMMKTSAEKFGGAGGGHKTRAGGELPLACESAFIASVKEYL
ncbi:DHH family phosphoesterase [Methanocorpusculaceae archaeon]|nr:DHH family phosphoesterase [Methanocorpusculaceae archaeon]